MSAVVKRWWEGFSFRTHDPEQLISGHSLMAVDVDPLRTCVQSSRSTMAFNLFTGGLRPRGYEGYRSIDKGVYKCAVLGYIKCYESLDVQLSKISLSTVAPSWR